MSWRTARVAIALRTVGRFVGLNRFIARRLRKRSYEDKFREAMLSLVCAGDCVWDVGANIGLYTTLFAEKVGPKGRVVAFEPSPTNLVRLREAVAGLANVTVLPVALGDRDARVILQQGADPIGAMSRIAENVDSGAIGTEVELVRGDCLVSDSRIATPSIIKIDTEGFELDVLNGLKQALSGKNIRVVCVEVHFGLLAQRGMPEAPATIEGLMRSIGFTCTWPDASHIVAVRNRV